MFQENSGETWAKENKSITRLVPSALIHKTIINVFQFLINFAHSAR